MSRIVLDTNVLVAGLRSRRGAANRLLRLVGRSSFEIALSVPLVLEYEDVLLRPDMVPFSTMEVRAFIDVLCQEGNPQRVYFLWRPYLPDPKDDMVLELAVAASCDAIVTYNLRDFRGVDRFGIRAVRPEAFLKAPPPF
ncbi:MAG: putative toxin-antitoxin system toxin component, PIN family [Bacteroidota bacterium]